MKGNAAALSGDTKTILFRTFQEVINNSLKHSGASTIEITIDQDPNFAMRISDNGRGFEESNIKLGGGLHNIRKRCELIDFRADLQTAPGVGCQWTFTQKEDHGI